MTQSNHLGIGRTSLPWKGPGTQRLPQILWLVGIIIKSHQEEISWSVVCSLWSQWEGVGCCNDIAFPLCPAEVLQGADLCRERMHSQPGSQCQQTAGPPISCSSQVCTYMHSNKRVHTVCFPPKINQLCQGGQFRQLLHRNNFCRR